MKFIEIVVRARADPRRFGSQCVRIISHKFFGQFTSRRKKRVEGMTTTELSEQQIKRKLSELRGARRHLQEQCTRSNVDKVRDAERQFLREHGASIPKLCFLRYNIPYCLDTECLRGHSLESPIGTGSNGSVFSTRLPNTKEHAALKIIPLNTLIATEDCRLSEPKSHQDCSYVTTAAFDEEVKLSKEMSRLGLGPHFYDAWMCEGWNPRDSSWGDIDPLIDYGIILMERLTGETLQHIFENAGWSADLQRALESLYDRWTRAGWWHRDLHASNILVYLDEHTGLPIARAIDMAQVSRATRHSLPSKQDFIEILRADAIRIAEEAQREHDDQEATQEEQEPEDQEEREDSEDPEEQEEDEREGDSEEEDPTEEGEEEEEEEEEDRL